MSSLTNPPRTGLRSGGPLATAAPPADGQGSNPPAPTDDGFHDANNGEILTAANILATENATAALQDSTAPPNGTGNAIIPRPNNLAEAVYGITPNSMRAIDIPKPSIYDGNGSTFALDQWMFAVEGYLLMGNISQAALQINIAGSLLAGPALTWYQSIQGGAEANRFTRWGQFRNAIYENFQPASLIMMARNQLADCAQVTTVRPYITEFRNLVLLIKDIAPGEQFDRFVRGLKPAIRKEIIMREVYTFADAARLAEKFEAATLMANPMVHPTPNPQPKPQGQRPIARLNAVKTVPSPTAVVRKTLTPEDREDLIRKGACFYCREEGHTIAECPTRPPRTGNGTGQ